MITIEDKGPIREIQLNRPPANALNPALVAELTQALEAAGAESQAVVVSGLPGMFSAGLDVPELMQLNCDGLSRFWQAFLKLLRTIAFMPVPTVFAMGGHAPAGGIVMALFADYRIMPKGSFKTGFNEVQVGLVVPSVIQKALYRCIGAHTAERILVAGEMMDSQRALDIGLVDELVDEPEQARARAFEWCEQHIALPREAMLATRQMARADLYRLFDDHSELGVEQFVRIWFSDSTRAALNAMLEQISKK